MHTIKPLDREAILEAAAATELDGLRSDVARLTEERQRAVAELGDSS